MRLGDLACYSKASPEPQVARLRRPGAGLARDAAVSEGPAAMAV
ncbi:hypothetical protein [Streptomyces sp. NPDC056670]